MANAIQAGQTNICEAILESGFPIDLASAIRLGKRDLARKMIREKPADFAKMIAGLMSKELTGEDGAPLFPSSVDWNVRKPAD